MGTARLGTEPNDIKRAADILRGGGLVAFPTDTVYGLGADATNDTAVARVFEAKGRPSFNPLIVHVSDVAMAERIGVLDAATRAFVDATWPEPVSIVVPLRGGADISPLVSAGHASVALRMPSSPIALQLLEAFGGPVAAPSANPSGQISPTTAEHVLASLDGKIDAVIDGGPCRAGVESTIISFLEETPNLLREGAHTPNLPNLRIENSVTDKPLAPGQLASHYAPTGKVRLNVEAADPNEFHIGFGGIAGDVNLSASGDLVEAAARLYAALHEANRRHATEIAVAPIPEQGIGRAINDRLRRAAAPRT